MGQETLESMTPAGARVAIAQDVLKHVAAKKLIVGAGIYFRMLDGDGQKRFIGPEEVGTDLRGLIRDKIPACKVCAKGALFVAHVLRFNSVSVEAGSNWLDESDVCRPLTENFSQGQLDLIESAFEGSDYTSGDPIDADDLKAAEAFYDEYPNAEARLIAIAENIIKNGGEFIP